MEYLDDAQALNEEHVGVAGARTKLGNSSSPAAIKGCVDAPALDSEALKQARRKISAMNLSEKLNAAGSEETSDEMLAVFAKNKDWLVRLSVAENPSTDPKVLVVLSHDSDEDVAMEAQLNSALPLTRILELAEQGDMIQRSNAALNPSLPYEYLLLMLNDESEYVRYWAEKALRSRSGPDKINEGNDE